MRVILTHGIALFLGLAIGAASVVVLLSQHEPTATLEVVNRTAEVIPSVRIHNSETGGTLAIDDLAPNAKETLRLYVRGEGSYRIVARFADETTLAEERYFETGYTISEQVHRDRIEPNFRLY